MNKKIIITGSSGLLGSTLLQTLARTGAEVIVAPREITNEKTLKDFSEKIQKADFVIHTAAITDVNYCEEHEGECRNINVHATSLVRDMAKVMGAHLFYISTASVFSGFEGNYKETDTPNPSNIYNKTKLEGETAALEYENSTVLRINLIGIHPSGSRGKNFAEWLFDTIKLNKDIKLFDDVFINPLSNLTLAEIISKLVEINPKQKIIHLGSRKPLSKADIGKMFIGVFPGYSGKISIVSVDTLAGPVRPKQMWLNVGLVEDVLEIEMPSLEVEVERILRSFSK